MRRSVALAVVLAFAGCGGGEKKEDKPSSSSSAPVSSGSSAPSDPPKAASNARELPFNPYAKVAAGDWYGALVKARYEGKTPQGALPAQSVWTWTGAPETDWDKAVIAFDTKPAIPEMSGTRTWSKKETPKAEEVLGGFKPEEITDWKAEDEKKTVGEKEFDCKKIWFKTASDEVTVWLSSDVAVTGIVAMVRKSDLGGGSTEIVEIEVGGFKSAEPQVTWGKTVEDLSKLLDNK